MRIAWEETNSIICKSDDTSTIMVYLTEKDIENIKKMNPECKVYLSSPEENLENLSNLAQSFRGWADIAEKDEKPLNDPKTYYLDILPRINPDGVQPLKTFENVKITVENNEN